MPLAPAERRSTARPRFLRRPPAGAAGLKRPALVLGALAAVVALGGPLLGSHGLPAYLRLREERADLDREVRELEAREQRLEEDLQALAEDPEMLEKVARERYRMHRPGERVIEVVDEEEAADAPESGASP